MARTAKISKPVLRYGIAEWYGHDFTTLSADRIRELAHSSFKTRPCPFKGHGFRCNKHGGVCSLRVYSRDGNAVGPQEGSSPVTVCPNRFYERNAMLAWAGEVLLSTRSPIVLTELPFLKAGSETDPSDVSTVGKIDIVLVHPDTRALRWCALEIQSVYFSGASMAGDFNLLKNWRGDGLPFPQGNRHPDFRSSGPKRLMPQLQIKVPTISRWGKKMAVVVDLPFWQALGKMAEVEDVSNCDIAWLVMRYRHDGKHFQMEPAEAHLTTLERAVEGLTGGMPTTLADFERILQDKLREGTPPLRPASEDRAQ